MSMTTKTLSACAALLLSMAVVSAQTPTPTALIPASGFNQLNTFQSCLIMTASVQGPGQASNPFPGFLSLFSPSSTWAYTCDANQTGVAAGSIAYVGVFEGTALQPFAIGITAVSGSLACGGGTPCMTQGSLFNTSFTPYGILHLDPNNLVLAIDGINNPNGPVGVLNQFGQFPLVGSVTVDTAANGGAEQRFAVQGLCADPSSPNGFTLSACLNIDQWVSQ